MADRTFYSGHGVQIVRDDLNWVVSTLATAGEKSRVPGVEVVRNQTYHGTLAQACEEAAQRVADRVEVASLKSYAEALRAIVGELAGVTHGH